MDAQPPNPAALRQSAADHIKASLTFHPSESGAQGKLNELIRVANTHLPHGGRIRANLTNAEKHRLLTEFHEGRR
jgi:hypothetical protein